MPITLALKPTFTKLKEHARLISRAGREGLPKLERKRDITLDQSSHDSIRNSKAKTSYTQKQQNLDAFRFVAI